jgi:hypothetical protein
MLKYVDKHYFLVKNYHSMFQVTIVIIMHWQYLTINIKEP